MLNYIVTLLLALGLIFSSADYERKTQEERKELQKKAGVVEEDIIG